MTADYTPTTDEITRYYIDGSRDWFPGLTTSERNERFDRWLAGEHARVLREAADALERATCEVKRTCHEADAITLRMRADRIERGEQP